MEPPPMVRAWSLTLGGWRGTTSFRNVPAVRAPTMAISWFKVFTMVSFLIKLRQLSTMRLIS
jgi:hypothetical protein